MTCEINSTVITENKKAIQTIYKMLWDIIALYEPTDAYNSLPNSDDNTDCRDYMDAQILNVRKELSCLFINDLISTGDYGAFLRSGYRSLRLLKRVRKRMGRLYLE